MSSRNHDLGRRKLHHAKRGGREGLLRPHVVDSFRSFDAYELAVVLEGADDPRSLADALVAEPLLPLVVVCQELLVGVLGVLGHVLEIAEPTETVAPDWTLRVALNVHVDLYHRRKITNC